MRERHAVLGLVGRVAEHDALIAGADIQVGLAHVHATRNVRRLLVDADEHLARLAREALGVDGGQVVHEGVVADLAHLRPDNLVVVEGGAGGDLAEDHHHVVLIKS